MVPGTRVAGAVGLGVGEGSASGLFNKLLGRIGLGVGEGAGVGVGVGKGVGALDPPPLETIGMAGVDVTELDAELSPLVLTAFRVIEYDVPFVSPVMTTGDEVTVGEKAVYVVPSNEYS